MRHADKLLAVGPSILKLLNLDLIMGRDAIGQSLRRGLGPAVVKDLVEKLDPALADLVTTRQILALPTQGENPASEYCLDREFLRRQIGADNFEVLRAHRPLLLEPLSDVDSGRLCLAMNKFATSKRQYSRRTLEHFVRYCL